MCELLTNVDDCVRFELVFFILFHEYRLGTLLLCRPRAPDSKDNSVHTTATLTLSSDYSLSIPLGGTAFPQALRWALRSALVLVPPRVPRHPSTDLSCCAVRRWALPSL